MNIFDVTIGELYQGVGAGGPLQAGGPGQHEAEAGGCQQERELHPQGPGQDSAGAAANQGQAIRAVRGDLSSQQEQHCLILGNFRFTNWPRMAIFILASTQFTVNKIGGTTAPSE